MARRSLIIVDDFYEDPQVVRQAALALDYPITGRFPGRNTRNYEVEASLRRVGRVLRMNIVVHERSRDISVFRLTYGSDEGRCDIHVDPAGWAGVCYLNLPGNCAGGTSFFRHKATGLTHWPSQEQAEALRAGGVIPPSELPEVSDLDAYFIREGACRDHWEEILTVPMIFNRAVFYDAKQFHSITAWRSFGDDPATARLTQLFFFSEHAPPVVA